MGIEKEREEGWSGYWDVFNVTLVVYEFPPQHDHKVQQLEHDFSLRTAQHNEVSWLKI